MSNKFFIDLETYHWLLSGLNKELYEGCKAKISDLDFIKDDSWLSKTAVIDHISKRNGTWCIDLVFAAQGEAMKLIVRKITSNTCRKKAALHGSIFRRQAAKDQRGTISISIDDYNIMEN